MGIGRNGSKHGRLGGQNTVERPFCAEAVGVGLKILAAKRLIHSKLQKVIVAKMAHREKSVGKTVLNKSFHVRKL